MRFHGSSLLVIVGDLGGKVQAKAGGELDDRFHETDHIGGSPPVLPSPHPQ
jgi:hypothetical protein